MPHPGFLWRHVTISTRSSWLPGDPRGWRSRKHRRHSSGDYKNPPPPGEHAGLHRYSMDHSAEKAVIPPAIRPRIGIALIHKLNSLGYRWMAAAVMATHVHILVELPQDLIRVKRIIGQIKQKASHAIRDALPGGIWAEGGDYEPVLTPSHRAAAYRYILEDQGPGAWAWSYKQGVPTL